MTDDSLPPATRPRPVRRCPICGHPSEHAFFPFCSKRCADVDLSRWLKGNYAIPVVEEDGAEPKSSNETGDSD